MTLTRSEFTARVRRLAGTLGELKHRVRLAVATETGKAVADAVRDLLTAALGGTSFRDPYRSSPTRSAYRREWDDPDSDGWDDEDREIPPSRWHHDPDDPAKPPPAPRWPAVLTLTTAAIRGWAQRRLPGWAAATVGLVAGAAAVVGGPLLHAGLTLAGAAADLFPHLIPTHVLA